MNNMINPDLLALTRRNVRLIVRMTDLISPDPLRHLPAP